MNNYQPLFMLLVGGIITIIVIAIHIFIIRWILRINAIIFYLEEQCEYLDKNNKELKSINENILILLNNKK